jgi:hypothetical protein
MLAGKASGGRYRIVDGDGSRAPAMISVESSFERDHSDFRPNMESNSTEQRFRSFAEFWPYYVQEHSRPATRWVHFVGSTLAVVLLIAAFVWRQWWLLLAIPVVGYGFAWGSHLGIEHNRPATFKYPLWSLAADWKMWLLMAGGRMGKEIARVNAGDATYTPAS